MITVLIVEDERHRREDIKEILELEGGYECIEAENGQIGLELARQHRPDLIICDVMMPVMDGYQMVKELKRDPKLTTIPVIMITARDMSSPTSPGIPPEFDSYLTKPFSAGELLDKIKAYSHRRES
ncbi:MAG: response regulator [Anaerolineae bacterium]|nr:response regulator [Anaerolineae bacterium]